MCDDWETVKHRSQTLSRMYKDGEISDDDIHANLVELVVGDKPGRESDEERIYFNAVGLAYVDVAIAVAMYQRAMQAGLGQDLQIQHEMIFEHAVLKDWGPRVRNGPAALLQQAAGSGAVCRTSAELWRAATPGEVWKEFTPVPANFPRSRSESIGTD